MSKKKKEKPAYKTRINKYKRDPFRPQPDLRIRPKSRRHHPVGEKADEDFCLRKFKRNKKGQLVLRCANSRKCAGCVPLYRLWKEKK